MGCVSIFVYFCLLVHLDVSTYFIFSPGSFSWKAIRTQAWKSTCYNTSSFSRRWTSCNCFFLHFLYLWLLLDCCLIVSLPFVHSVSRCSGFSNWYRLSLLGSLQSLSAEFPSLLQIRSLEEWMQMLADVMCFWSSVMRNQFPNTARLHEHLVFLINL